MSEKGETRIRASSSGAVRQDEEATRLGKEKGRMHKEKGKAPLGAGVSDLCTIPSLAKGGAYPSPWAQKDMRASSGAGSGLPEPALESGSGNSSDAATPKVQRAEGIILDTVRS